MRHIAIALVLGAFLASFANAEEVISAGSTQANNAANGSHECAPPGASNVKDDSETTIGLDYRISPEGKATGILVSETSGNKDLDDTAIQCVSNWSFYPTAKDGKPAERPWGTFITWKVGKGQLRSRIIELPTTRGLPIIRTGCVQRIASSRELSFQMMMVPSGATTSLAYFITLQGTVRDVTVMRSSGSMTLDLEAALCVSEAHYKPAIKDGQPAEIPWHAEVAWGAK